MKVRRKREREVWCPPSVPWCGCSQLLICSNLIDPTKMSVNNMADLIFHAWMAMLHPSTWITSIAERTNLFPRHTSRCPLAPSPPRDLSNHLQSVVYFEGGFFFNIEIYV